MAAILAENGLMRQVYDLDAPAPAAINWEHAALQCASPKAWVEGRIVLFGSSEASLGGAMEFYAAADPAMTIRQAYERARPLARRPM